MQDELSIEKARVAILVEERNDLLRKVFELEEQVRRLTQRATDAGCDVCRDGVPGWDEEWLFCPYCGSTLRR